MDDRIDSDEIAAVERCADDLRRVRTELAKVLVGLERSVDDVVVTLLSGGHALLEGPSGLAKGLLASSLATAMALKFARVTCTCDLEPERLAWVAAPAGNSVRELEGPLGSNLVLAEEVQNAPQRTLALLLDAIRDRNFALSGEKFRLPAPCCVLATRSAEPSTRLSQPQLDRFLLSIRLDYPSHAEEWEIVRRATIGFIEPIHPVLASGRPVEFQRLAPRVPVADQVLGHALALVRGTRPGAPATPDFINAWVSSGAGPRGALALLTAAKTRALVNGRFHATSGDVEAMAAAALRHRIVPSFTALAEGIGPDQIIQRLLEAYPADARYERPKE